MITKELRIFLVVGSLTVLLDYLVYRAGVWVAVPTVHLAKAIGFVAGTIFAYLANRYWTFGNGNHATGSMWRFAALYAATLLLNTGVNGLALLVLGQLPGAVQLAFLLATGLSATLNFIGMKYFVFHVPTQGP